MHMATAAIGRTWPLYWASSKKKKSSNAVSLRGVGEKCFAFLSSLSLNHPTATLVGVKGANT